MQAKTETRKTYNNEKSYRGVFWIFTAICLVIAIFCFQYYNNLSAIIKEESKSYLQEVSRRIGANIDRIISDNYAVLYSMAENFDLLESTPAADVVDVLKEQKSYWNYETILLIDSAGRAFDLNGNEVFLDLEDSVRSDMLAQQETMSTTQIVNNKEYILFSVPMLDVAIEGNELVSMAAIFDPMQFDQTLSMTSFDEQAYSQIVTKSGTAVTRSSSKYALNTGYNVLSTLEGAEIDTGSIEGVEADIQADKEGQIGFRIDGKSMYMVYTPISTESWYLLTFVPVETVNARSDLLLGLTIVLSVIVTIVFAILITMLAYMFRQHKRRLERMAFVDVVTNGNTIQRFYDIAGKTLDLATGKHYALVFTNMEKFKIMNEQLGQKKCDTILTFFNNLIQGGLEEGECIGRHSADHFCILIEYVDEGMLTKRFSSWYDAAEKHVNNVDAIWSLPVVEFGIYVIENNLLSFSQMIDRAKLALKEAQKHLNSKVRYAFYDEDLRKQLFRDKQLEDMMEEALRQKQFKVFLQPKYRLPAEVIGGAEALVRWENPEEGMIFPNEFIPLFEKNGFIIDLDLFVFEEVCRTLRTWIDNGLNPMKISVNCSRIHFKDTGFLAPYIRIAEEHRIDRKLIEIEVTESVLLENVDKLIIIIEKIHEAGFSCSMDDFGSGYSSLNLIQSIPVDTLKIDRIFFKVGYSEMERNEAVVGSIVGMAKALDMETVAEGVEIPEQVEMLKRVGCEYIQGYVYARPMTITAFEELAFGKKDKN